MSKKVRCRHRIVAVKSTNWRLAAENAVSIPTLEAPKRKAKRLENGIASAQQQPEQQQKQRSPTASNAYLLPSDVISVVAEFIQPHMYFQGPLMAVSKTWLAGVVAQDGMKPKPSMRWPVIALQQRDPRKLRLLTPEALRVLNQFPNVEEVSMESSCIAGTTSAKNHAMLAQLKNLKSLHLSSGHGIWNKALEDISTHYSDKITSLEISDPGSKKAATGKSIQTHLLQLVNLVSLTISSTAPITVEALKHIAKLPRLTSLDLHGSPAVTNTSMKDIASIKSLRNLNISDCRHVSEKGFELLGGMKQLTSLAIGSMDQIAEASLNAVVGGLPELRTLDVRETCLSDETLEPIGSLAHLHSLAMFVEGISAEGLKHLQACKQLASLDVVEEVDEYGCPFGETEWGLEEYEAISELKSLASLSISCKELNNDIMDCLVRLEHLESLTLQFDKEADGDEDDLWERSAALRP